MKNYIEEIYQHLRSLQIKTVRDFKLLKFLDQQIEKKAPQKASLQSKIINSFREGNDKLGRDEMLNSFNGFCQDYHDIQIEKVNIMKQLEESYKFYLERIDLEMDKQKAELGDEMPIKEEYFEAAGILKRKFN